MFVAKYDDHLKTLLVEMGGMSLEWKQQECR